MSDIEYTQRGQSHSYGDSIYAGTVKASSEEEAREKLEEAREVSKIYYKDQDRPWHCLYFARLEKVAENTWKFKIVRPYTG